VAEDSLRQRIRTEMTAALRAGEKVRLGALRMLQAAVTNREKDVLHELSDEEVREVAGREVKKRTESIEAFDTAGRTDLADRERAEREVLAGFAPKPLSEEQVDALIDEAIASTGATSPRELGAVMGKVMQSVKGRADGAVVQAKVRSRLGG
jgi:uncharacterized protein YqeY